MSIIEILPPEVIGEIIKHLSISEQFVLCNTCKFLFKFSHFPNKEHDEKGKPRNIKYFMSSKRLFKIICGGRELSSFDRRQKGYYVISTNTIYFAAIFGVVEVLQMVLECCGYRKKFSDVCLNWSKKEEMEEPEEKEKEKELKPLSELFVCHDAFKLEKLAIVHLMARYGCTCPIHAHISSF